MRNFLIVVAIVLLSLGGNSTAQAIAPPAVAVPSDLFSAEDVALMNSILASDFSADDSAPPLTPPSAVLPLMSSELALQAYQSRSARQTSDLASYTATTVIHAELPETKQQGEYEVKRRPHKKRLGLIKGTMLLDARTGSLVRLEGVPAKSPSVFLSKIRLEQDYADFGPFTLPVHVHSEAKASIVGKTIIDVYHRDYQVVPGAVQTAQGAGQ